MQRRVALVDGMTEIQGMGKSEWINNCLHLSEHFNHRVQQNYGLVDELPINSIIFGMNDVPASMKHLTRQYRYGNIVPVEYHIIETTNIANVQMRTLLAGTREYKEATDRIFREKNARNGVGDRASCCCGVG